MAGWTRGDHRWSSG